MQLAVAESVPPKLIVFAVFGLIWLLTAIFGSKKSTTIVSTTPRRGPGIGIPAPVRQTPQQQWRARVEQLGGVAANPPPPPMPKQRARGKAKPQPVTVTQAAQLARQAAQGRSTIAAKPAVAAPLATQPRSTNETAKNLRLLLQRGGVREAFLLSEILSAPKSMRE